MDTKKAISMFLIVSSMLVVVAFAAQSCQDACVPQCLQQNPWATIAACQGACADACRSIKNSIKGQDTRLTFEEINALGKGKLH